MPHSPTEQHLTDILDLLQALGDSEGDTGINVGGGFNDSLIGLAEEDLATQQQSFQQSFGLNLFQQLIGLQDNPFSLVPALQAFGAAGGGPLAPAVAFDATGGAGNPSPYGNLVQELLAGLSAFALGTGVPGGGEGGVPGTPPDLQDMSVRDILAGLLDGTITPEEGQSLAEELVGLTPEVPGTPPENDPEALLAAVTKNAITALEGYEPSTPLEATNILSQLDQLQAAGVTTIGGVPIGKVIDIISRAAADPKSTDPAEVQAMIKLLLAGLKQVSNGQGAQSDLEGMSIRDILAGLLDGTITPKEGQRLAEKLKQG